MKIQVIQRNIGNFIAMVDCIKLSTNTTAVTTITTAPKVMKMKLSENFKGKVN